jgi:hypothetical protein
MRAPAIGLSAVAVVMIGGVAVLSGARTVKDCQPADGAYTVVKAMPPGFSVKWDGDLPPPPGASVTIRETVLDHQDKPWVAPGGPAGRRIRIDTMHHEAEPSSGELRPEGWQHLAALGANQVMVSEKRLTLQSPTGPQQVPVTVAVARVSNTVDVSIAGEGLSEAELLAFARTLEVQ